MVECSYCLGDNFNDTIEECATELRNLIFLILQIVTLISICITNSNFQYYTIHRISW